MKIVIKFILLAGVLSYMVFAIVTMSRDDDQRICQGIRIYLEDAPNKDFVDSSFVAGLLSSADMQIQNQHISDIDINGTEAIIRNNPYIDSVTCYYTPEDVMCIKVIPRTPVLHVMAENGESYYMDDNGNDMPTSHFALDLCLATGNITKQFAKEHLLPIAHYINEHEPWNKDIQQIYVKTPKHLELIPTIEGHKIILGEPVDLESKMKRLSAFYEECLNKVGWNKYSVINLNFADQVVCTKKKK